MNKIDIQDQLIKALITSNQQLGYELGADAIKKWWEQERIVIEAKEIINEKND